MINSMIIQDKFYKICKYSDKLKNSYISNDQDNYKKYCEHLKYHISKQIGSGINPELDTLFDNLTKYINENKDKFNNDYLKLRLKELYDEKYDEFIILLTDIFKKIFNDEIANKIINEIKEGKNNKIKQEKEFNDKFEKITKKLTDNLPNINQNNNSQNKNIKIPKIEVIGQNPNGTYKTRWT